MRSKQKTDGRSQPGAGKSSKAAILKSIKKSHMTKLNLGCGSKLLADYINVDKYGKPDILKDLEELPWEWEDNSVEEILMIHVLEHLGQATEVYLGIWKELYRICKNNAMIKIAVPHYKHEFFFDDPTHVRAITPLGLQLFSKKNNRIWVEKGASNSPLGMQLDIDFDLIRTEIKPSEDWFELHPEEKINFNLKRLVQESRFYGNLIEQYTFTLKCIKQE